VNSQSPNGSDGDNDKSLLYDQALLETRNVIEVQVEMAENTDEEALTIIRLNFLSLGGIVTLIAYVPELIKKAIPWVALSVLLLSASILISAFIYRGITLYAGFGDHGYDKHAPEQKLKYNFIIDSSYERSTPDNSSLQQGVPRLPEFQAALLNEHQAGISHNNIEIKYRSQIHQHASWLLLIAVLTIGLGLTVALSDTIGNNLKILLVIITIIALLVAVYTLIRSIGLLSRFIQTNEDPDRLSYGYAFEREYPYFSKVCKFVNKYLYDPVEEEW